MDDDDKDDDDKDNKPLSLHHEHQEDHEAPQLLLSAEFCLDDSARDLPFQYI